MNRNHTLKEWSQLYLKDGKVDRFIDELIRLAAVLWYSGEVVKDRAHLGMTDILNAARSMKTPPSSSVYGLPRPVASKWVPARRCHQFL